MLKAEHLTRRYGNIVAVDDISLSVAPGEVVGLLGPNGAGKTTTMRMLAGYLVPDSGSASLGGLDIVRQRKYARQKLGYLPENAPLYSNMTPYEFLTFIARVHRLKHKELRSALDETIALLELQPVLEQPIATLSKGYRHRVSLAQAILHKPEILILDEPTDGLDPNQKKQVRKIIQRLAEGRSVLISTHILEEVSVMCQRATVIAHGKKVADASVAELLRESRYYQAVTIRLAGGQKDHSSFIKLPNIQSIEVNSDDSITFFPSKSKPLFEILWQHVQQQQIEVSEWVIEAGRLEDVFQRLTLSQEKKQSSDTNQPTVATSAVAG